MLGHVPNEAYAYAKHLAQYLNDAQDIRIKTKNSFEGRSPIVEVIQVWIDERQRRKVVWRNRAEKPLNDTYNKHVGAFDVDRRHYEQMRKASATLAKAVQLQGGHNKVKKR
jgi:hypothetical protein